MTRSDFGSKDAILVLSVLKDDKDKSLLRFVDVGPIYVSPDYEVGIDDAIRFFPHDYDDNDGEIKIWLAQQLVHDEEMAAGDEYDGEGEGELLSDEDNVAAEQLQQPAAVAVG